MVILNFASDLLVNDDDMEKALKSGRVKRYITDFPNPKTVGMEGVIAIQHLGASTEESEDNCAVMAVEELKDYLENGNIRHSVNSPDCDMGVCRGACRIAVLHRNIPNMIGQVTAILADCNVNISEDVYKRQDEPGPVRRDSHREHVRRHFIRRGQHDHRLHRHALLCQLKREQVRPL